MKKEIIAVIDIGSSAIRLLIAQGSGISDWELMESAEQPLAVGRDVFRTGYIKKSTINRAVEILKSFKELIAPFGNIRIAAIATSAVREAENREIFIDRILLQTGIEIRIIDGIEANQFTWLAVRESLKNNIKDFSRQNILIIEVGAGNTDVMLLKNGKVAGAFALPVGTLRFLQKLEGQKGSTPESIKDFFRKQTERTVGAISHELDLKNISKLVAIGNDARLVAGSLGEKINSDLFVIPGNAFKSYINELQFLSTEEMVAKLNIPFMEADLIYPAMIIYDTFVRTSEADEIYVSFSTIRHGLLINYAASRSTLINIFRSQVISGAMNIARNYKSDIDHAQFVRNESLKIYRELNKEFALKGQHRLFLETAAILHDTGSFISPLSHHKHSQYIVRNTDIFGLSSMDRKIIGHIVRYHRKALPQRSHSSYMSLSREQRIIVQQLSAILRTADALDRSHTGKITINKITISGGEFIMQTGYSGDISMEQMSLKEKGNLFENVFGLKPVLTV